MVFKCKMCDAALQVIPGERVVTCEYCGSEQTLPCFNDEKMLNLYDRASHYRRNNEFDKAQALYEQILEENPEDAELYWSVILCKYGIEYVEEGGKRVPTVNRTQSDTIFDDAEYLNAVKYATPEQRTVYEAEAKRIDEIQKEILAISRKEEPFDIFICYKETDEDGRRTLDSVLAADLYETLQGAGYKVFFARITLDDKFGEAYEPYIFAALQSSKVMIAIGTKPEHFEAVWVKNEWSRYLGLIKNGAKKTLIPAYKDMDPYDMPKEFAHLQAIHLGELGFQQDLLSGIRKIFESKEQPAEDENEEYVNVDGLLDRGFFGLEEKEWALAGECFDKVLKADKTNVRAYLGKLLFDLKLTGRNELEKCPTPFDHNENYRKILMLGNEEMILFVNDALERSRELECEAIYEQTVRVYENTLFEDALLKCAEKFERLGAYKDSKEMAEKCRQRAVEVVDQREYEKYQRYSNLTYEDDLEELEAALRYFKSVPGYRDADEKVKELRDWVDKKYVREGGVFREARKRNAARNRNMKASGASSMEDMLDSFEKKASMLPYIVMGAVVLIVVVMLIVMVASAYV
ncbi:MAG: TIR domain-containing protein [Lachnospiraceae bacterium]|nr:TIR domain-containing protein [Lachnospiraceae bacterium]